MPAFLLELAIIESFIIFSFTDRYVQKCGSLPVIRLSSSSSSSFNTDSFDFRSFLSSASRTELGCVPNTRSMKNAYSCFLVIPTYFNLDLQFFLKWLKHLRPVAFGTVSANALFLTELFLHLLHIHEPFLTILNSLQKQRTLSSYRRFSTYYNVNQLVR